jgi:hypothetical protein
MEKCVLLLFEDVWNSLSPEFLKGSKAKWVGL